MLPLQIWNAMEQAGAAIKHTILGCQQQLLKPLLKRTVRCGLICVLQENADAEPGLLRKPALHGPNLRRTRLCSIQKKCREITRRSINQTRLRVNGQLL